MNSDEFYSASQTVLRFWSGMDRRDYPSVVGLLTDDCRWLREHWLVGAAAIAAALDQRPLDLSTRHQVTNMIGTIESDDGVMRYLLTVFAGKTEAGNTEPLPSAFPILIADVEMQCARKGEAWIISRIEPSIVFRNSQH